MYNGNGKGRLFFYMFYGSLVVVAAIYGYATTSYLVDTTAATPKLAEALLQGAHHSDRAPASAQDSYKK
jgi:hypothetical protein